MLDCLGPDGMEISEGRPLIDRFGREVDYLRISVTDRCDLRCVYCMSENMQFLPREQLLTLEEHARIGAAFVDLGVKKIRITGGEPLTRKNIIHLFKALGKLDKLEELTVTTNGTLLSEYAVALKAAGVNRINISIDTLRPDQFKSITRIGDINHTLAGIDAVMETGFDRVKLNAVIMKGRNCDQIIPLAEFALNRGIDICFIEEMPLGVITEHHRAAAYCSSDEILKTLQQHFQLIPTTETTAGPSRYYRVAGKENRIGLISPHSHNFCDACNRVRLTAEGQLLLCLGQEHSADLKQIIRANPLDQQPLHRAIVKAMEMKPKGHEFNLRENATLSRYMNVTGG